MFQRLWINLSVAFATIMLIFSAVVLALLFFLSDNGSVFRAAIVANIQNSAATQQLVRLYEQQGTWQPVIAFLELTTSQPDLMDATTAYYTLVDAQGQLIYSTGDEASPTIAQERLNSAVVLRSGDNVIGYIDVGIPTPPVGGSAETRLIKQLQRTMVVVVSTSVIFGIVSGVVISRTLTRPLEQLADWAVDAKNLMDKRVPEFGATVEVTSLATTIGEMIVALRQSEELRRDLVADVAHELRTPLTVLQGNIYGMIDRIYPCDDAQLILLRDQTLLLSRLVHDLHELAQAEANQLTFHMSRVVLLPVLEDTINQFQFQTAEKGLNTLLTVQTSQAEVYGDAERLQQVFNNLMSNALRHADDTSVIEIKLERERDNLIISVCNVGETIPPENLRKLFERFYRTDESRHRASGGSGLGLAISRAIIEAHQGDIWVTSALRETTFYVRLPLLPKQFGK